MNNSHDLPGNFLEKLACVALQIRLPAKVRDQRPRWTRSAWIFRLRCERDADELEACWRYIGSQSQGYLSSQDLPDGKVVRLIRTHAENTSSGQYTPNMSEASVAFAALQAWGCGPIDGARDWDAPEIWSTGDLAALLERCELGEASEGFLAEPSSKSSQSRL